MPVCVYEEINGRQKKKKKKVINIYSGGKGSRRNTSSSNYLITYKGIAMKVVSGSEKITRRFMGWWRGSWWGVRCRGRRRRRGMRKRKNKRKKKRSQKIDE